MRLRVRPFPGRPATPPADSVGERSETTRGLDHLAANGLRRPDGHVGEFHRRNINPPVLFVIAGDPCEAGVARILPLRLDGDDVALLDHGLAPFGWKHWPDARMARKKARHFRRAKSWESAANRGDRKLDQFTRASCCNSHTACGYYGLGSSPAGERLRLDGQ